MFGAYIRAVLTIGVAVLVAALLKFIAPFFYPYLGPEDGMLYRGFEGIAEYGLFIMLLAIGAGLVARAVVESDAGGI